MRFYCPDTRSVILINKIKNNEAHKIAKNAFEKYSNLAYTLLLLLTFHLRLLPFVPKLKFM
jgi:hypothetical protein